MFAAFAAAHTGVNEEESERERDHFAVVFFVAHASHVSAERVNVPVCAEGEPVLPVGALVAQRVGGRRALQELHEAHAEGVGLALFETQPLIRGVGGERFGECVSSRARRCAGVPAFAKANGERAARAGRGARELDSGAGTEAELSVDCVELIRLQLLAGDC